MEKQKEMLIIKAQRIFSERVASTLNSKYRVKLSFLIVYKCMSLYVCVVEREDRGMKAFWAD